MGIQRNLVTILCTQFFISGWLIVLVKLPKNWCLLFVFWPEMSNHWVCKNITVEKNLGSVNKYKLNEKKNLKIIRYYST